MGRDHDVGQLTDAVHRQVTVLDVYRQTDRVVLLQVLVVEYGVAGKDGQTFSGLDGERLAAHRVPADVKGSNAWNDLRRFVVYQDQPVTGFAGEVGQDVTREENIRRHTWDRRVKGEVPTGTRDDELGIGEQLGV